MKNEAVSVQVPTKVYLDLAFQLRKNGDQRDPDQVVGLAIRSGLASRAGKTACARKPVAPPVGTVSAGG